MKLNKWPTVADPFYDSKKHCHKLLQEQVDELSSLQRLHYASNRYALLLIFQGMDSAGKDGAIRHVMSVNDLEMAYPKTTAKRRSELKAIREEL